MARGIGLDGRIGRKFLHPGPGFGGSCFPKDTLALMRIAQDAGAPSRLVETTVAVNDARKAGMAARDGGGDAAAACAARRSAVLGLTFKPETDDMRDSPAIPIVSRLVEDGATVRAYDPEGATQAIPLLPSGVVYAEDAMDAADGADALVVITEWNEFRALSPERLKAAMKGAVLVDLRNVYDPVAMRQAGFAYHGIGRPSHAAPA